MPRKTQLSRRKPIVWKEPPRRGRGPSVTAEEAANRLKLSIERIHQLASYGPEYDGLPAYIAVGSKWERRSGNHSTKASMFYPEDLEAWNETHPFLPERERVYYTNDQQAFVLGVASRLRQPDGSVYRQKLRQELASERPGEGWGTTSMYPTVRQILEDAHIPLPARTPQTTQRRKYRVS